MKINPDELTLAEIEQIEDESGIPVDQLFGPKASKGRALRWAALAFMRRTDPDAVFEDTATLKMTDVDLGSEGN